MIRIGQLQLANSNNKCKIKISLLIKIKKKLLLEIFGPINSGFNIILHYILIILRFLNNCNNDMIKWFIHKNEWQLNLCLNVH